MHFKRLTAALLFISPLAVWSSHAQIAPAAGGAPSPAAYAEADAGYKAYAKGDYAAAAGSARNAVRLAPANGAYQLLLVNALFGAGLYDEAETAATRALDIVGEDSTLLSQRGLIRQRLGKTGSARQDFDRALRAGNLRAPAEIGLLAEMDRGPEARLRFDAAERSGGFADTPDVEVAYLATRVGNDDAAYAAFNRADTAGRLANTAYQDAAFAALRTHNDAEALAYFKRAIDENNANRLRLPPQKLFETRRAISEVDRTTGLIASLTYRGPVAGLGPASSAGTDTLQAGVEGYWRPWGYRNGRYTEVFARAFETLHNQGGETGGDTLQAAVGIRHKPLSQLNLVVSLSRVFSPSGGREDWLAQLGYSGGSGADLRAVESAWWTTRFSAEAGRYLSDRQHYALANAEFGRSFRMSGGAYHWVLFPHLSLGADYDSVAAERSAAGAGPGIGARYRFREDQYHAPRSYLDLSLQYRFRLGGAPRAKGTFATATLSY